MTGAEFYLQLQNAYDKAYSAYLDAANANRLIRRSIIRMVDKIYSTNDTQKEGDELASLIVKNETHLTPAGRITADTFTYPYLHLLRMGARYKESITFTYANGVFSSSSNLRKGDVLTLSGATNPASNKDYTVTKVRPGKFYLDLTYVDGVLNLYRTFEATSKTSDRKISYTSTAEIYNPRYEQTYFAGSLIPNAFTVEPVPYSVTIDYVMLPDQDIDVENDVSDLLDYYTEKFLYRLIDECVKTFAVQTHDYQTAQALANEIMENP